jgi:hypothetical protein
VHAWGTRSVANRMLSCAYKRFDGQVPEPGELDDEDRALLARVEAGFETVGALPQGTPAGSGRPPGFPRASLGEAMGPPKALRLRRVWRARRMSTHSLRFLRFPQDRQCMPGPQGAVVPDRGGPAGGGHERVRHAERACRGQPEDDPGIAGPAAHGAEAPRVPGVRGPALRQQQVVEYQEETRSHQALTYRCSCLSNRGADGAPI